MDSRHGAKSSKIMAPNAIDAEMESNDEDEFHLRKGEQSGIENTTVKVNFVSIFRSEASL